MEQVIKELTELGKEIARAKQERSELVGAEKQYVGRLKSDFGLADEEAAQKEIEQLTAQRDELGEKIDAGFKGLKEQYEW